jgi:3-deoxy-D-manno-octulosonic-acid transferase
MQRLLRRVSMFYVRTPADAENFKTLGAPVERVQEMGNLKIDNLHVISNDEKRARRTELWGNVSGPVIVAGSTWGVEEKTLLDVRGARLVIAPRRPERFDEVARLLESSGRSFSRWSKIKGAAWTTDILLVDTLGDLGRMYQAADVAFIGGSLEPRGGQNPLEAAAARVPSVFGPSMHNFKWEAAALVRSGAAVQSADAVASLNDLIQNESRRRTMGDAAARFVEQNQGVAKKTGRSSQ